MEQVGYFTDLSLGQPVFRCMFCPWDGFDENAAKIHAKNHGLTRILMDDADVVCMLEEQQSHGWGVGKRITISFLTWNTAEASYLGAKAIAGEIERLLGMGIYAKYHWVDNGSTDETIALVSSALTGLPGSASLFSENRGHCIGRNDAINAAMADDADFLLMVDGDIEIIPYSGYAMMMYLLSQPDDIGCIGMLSSNCTHEYDPNVSKYCLRIEPQWVRREPRIAWTNYGLFRAEMFRKGLRFDESGPFSGPGWGYEDDDFYLQMVEAGYDARVTPMFRHYHRKRNSSIGNLGREFARKMALQRRDYMIAKWKDIPSAQWRVKQIGASTLPQVPVDVKPGRERFRATV